MYDKQNNWQVFLLLFAILAGKPRCEQMA